MFFFWLLLVVNKNAILSDLCFVPDIRWSLSSQLGGLISFSSFANEAEKRKLISDQKDCRLDLMKNFLTSDLLRK